MKTNPNCLNVRTSCAGLSSATLALALMLPTINAAVADDAVKALTEPTSKIEVGAGYVSEKSFKAGEYDGLNDDGPYGIGNLDIRGGGTYDSESATRWRVAGSNLGLETRNVLGEFGQQGNFRFTYGHDEIEHNITDSYKTLWNGAGSSTLTLPSQYPAANTRVGSTANANAALSNWNNIQAPYATAACAATGGTPTAACRGPGFLIPSLMKDFDVETKRTIDGLTFNKWFAAGWDFKAAIRHEEKDGTKLTGVNMNRFTGPSSLLPEPIDSTTDIVDGSIGFIGGKGHFRLGYKGSFYKNDTDTWSAQYAGGASTTPIPGNVAHMQAAPDNHMHQINLAGGYNFTNTTKLVLNGAYTNMRQDEAFLAIPTGATWVLPETSAHAKVENTFLSGRLTMRPLSKLSLNAAYKYDYRDNQTPIHDFLVTPDLRGASTQVENEPINRQLMQANLDASYALTYGQAINAGYEWQEIQRTADSEESPFRAKTTWEHTISAEYRNTMLERVTGRLAYAYSRRDTSRYEEGEPRSADPLLPGFRQFFLADRNRHKLRGAFEFQVTEAISLQTNVAYNLDDYSNSVYGLKEARSWTVDLDGDYVVSDKLTFTAYYTYEDMKARLESYAMSRGAPLPPAVLPAHTACAPFLAVPEDFFAGDACRNWSEAQSDLVHTLGMGFKSTGLIDGKFDLAGDFAYSYARSPIDTTGGSYYNNGVQNVFVPAKSFSDVTTHMAEVKLSGVYNLNRSSSVGLHYLYRDLSTQDWQYDAYSQSRLGVTAVQGYIGPGIISPNFGQHIVAVTYMYRFNL